MNKTENGAPNNAAAEPKAALNLKLSIASYYH